MKENIKKGVATIKATIPETGKEATFYAYTNPEIVEFSKVDSTWLERQLEADIKKIRLGLPMAMKKIAVSYNLAEESEQPPFGNTLVEVNIPYCLHMPNGTELKIKTKDQQEALVFCNKIWTQKAAGSSYVDFFEEDEATYFQNVEILTPKIPTPAELGWDADLTGKDVEKISDTTGYFRYSQLKIYLKTEYERVALGENMEDIEKIKDFVLNIINNLLDIYRYETGEYHAERLGFANITNIYFFDKNFGVHLMDMPVQGAMLNQSNKKILKIKEALSRGETPPLHSLLILNADSYLQKRMYSFAIISAFQAADVFLENFLIDLFRKNNLPEKDIHINLNKFWRTKDRIKKLIYKATGHSIVTEKNLLWSNWNSSYKIRNNLIHKGQEPSKEKTEKAIQLNKEVIEWASGLFVDKNPMKVGPIKKLINWLSKLFQ